MGRWIRNAKGDSQGTGQDHERPCDFRVLRVTDEFLRTTGPRQASTAALSPEAWRWNYSGILMVRNKEDMHCLGTRRFHGALSPCLPCITLSLQM